MLRTFNYRKRKPSLSMDISCIYFRSFVTQSTAPNNHHLLYSDIEKLRISLTKEMPIITWSSARFQQIKYLTIEMPKIRSSMWNHLFNVGNKNVFLLNLFIILYIFLF